METHHNLNISIPIVGHFDIGLEAKEIERLKIVSKNIIETEPALTTTEFFGELTASGLGTGPKLMIGDHREIALARPNKQSIYEYRLSLLASHQDLVIIGGERDYAFEQYVRKYLKLGAVDYLTPKSINLEEMCPLPLRCQLDHLVLQKIISTAITHGQLTIFPGLGTGSAWVLAATIAQKSNVKIFVASPPPRLTRRANNKLWFADVVKMVLGPQSRPPIYSAYGPTALTSRIHALSKKFERVVAKVPDSAGSAGNLNFWSANIRKMSLSDLRLDVLKTLSDLGWKGSFPLLVQVWDCAVLSNASVQIWVPNSIEGPPILEGIFEQSIEGVSGKFVGTNPTELPENLKFRIAEEALKISTVLQSCGYFGRCSFDAVVSGKNWQQSEVHWIECNGRWGGVSIPMTLLNRINDDWAESPFLVGRCRTSCFNPSQFKDIVTELEDCLFDSSRNGEGLIILSPIDSNHDYNLHFMTIGKTIVRAKEIAQAIIIKIHDLNNLVNEEVNQS